MVKKEKFHIEAIIYICGVVILFLIMINFLVPKTIGQAQLPYPPPGTLQPYPFPGMNSNSNRSNSTTTVATPQITALKDGHVLSSKEISEFETYAYERALLSTPVAPISIRETPSYLPIKSYDDLSQVIYHDTFFRSLESGFAVCIQSREPGLPLLVHSLDGDPDYYLVPYYRHGELCAKVSIEIKNDLGYVTAIGQAFGKKYPQVSADEAVQLVIKKTGKQVVEKPYLAFVKSKEVDPLNPFWQITTSDNLVYYVIFLTGMTETNFIPETMVTILRSDEIHTLK